MNCLDSVKCQKSRKWDISEIYGKFNERRQKPNSVIFFILEQKSLVGYGFVF